MHLGYHRGTKVNKSGVNVREQDVIDAAFAGVRNLLDAGVSAIVDLGDMAHVPAPKKRAVLALIELVSSSGIPWYSANGNHTLQRSSSDIHLYNVLATQCPSFKGYTKPTYVPEIGAALIP